MSSKIKKDPKNQWVFAKKLLKITRIILIVVAIFYLSYALLQKPLSVFGDDFIGEVINLFSPLVFFVLLYVFVYLWALDRRINYNQYTKEELPSVIKVKAVNDRDGYSAHFLLCFFCEDVVVGGNTRFYGETKR